MDRCQRVSSRSPARLAIALAGLLVGCQSLYQSAPHATTPTMGELAAVIEPGGPFTTKPRDTVSGVFEVLPSGLPSSGVKLYIYALYPASLRVDLNGTMPLPDSKEAPAGTDFATTGYFRIEDINANANPPIWTVGVRPPNAFAMSSSYTINIRHVSLNPNYKDAQGNPEVSAPLPVPLGTQMRFLVSVVFAGTGHGRISIPNTNENCTVDCTIGPYTNPTLTLAANSSQGSTFAGWGGVCMGSTGSTCVVANNGMGNLVQATFNTTTASTNPQNCPSIEPPPTGYMYYDKPRCDSQNVYNDPTPDLACNSQGYFCCAKTSNINSADCGTDHTRFSADCMYGNPKVAMFPAGCFIDTR